MLKRNHQNTANRPESQVSETPKKLPITSLETTQAISEYLREFKEPPNQPGSAGPCGSSLIFYRHSAHKNGKCYSNLNGAQPIFALLSYQDIQNLEGRLLTIVDASFSDLAQRRAVKDLVRNALWVSWVPNLDTDNKNPEIPNQ